MNKVQKIAGLMKKMVLTSTLLLFVGLCVQAQEDNFFESDQGRIFLLLEQATYLINQDSTRQLLEEAYRLSKEMNFQKGMQLALFNRSKFEFEQDQLALALQYGLQTQALIDEEEDPIFLSNLFVHLGNIYERENLHQNAKNYYQLALPIQDPKSLDSQVKLFRLLGNAHYNLNEVDSAKVYFLNLSRLFIMRKDTQQLLNTYRDIVQLYHKNKQYEQSLEYNFKIRDILEDRKDVQNLAIINNNIGYDYSLLKNYERAIEYYKLTEEACKEKEHVDMAILYTNIGVTYNNQGRLEKAISYLRKASDLQGKRNTKDEKAKTDNLLATLYLGYDDIYNALRHNEEAMSHASEMGNYLLLKDVYFTHAEVHQRLYEYEKALDYYKKHLALRDSFRLEERIRQQELLQQQLLLERSEKEIRLLLVQQDVQELAINQLELEKDKLQLESVNLRLEGKAKEDELALLKGEQEIRDANLRNKELETERAQQELALVAQRLDAEKKDRAIFELRQKEEIERLAQKNLEQENQFLKKDKELLIKDKALLTKEQDINRLELQRQRSFRQFVYWLGGLLFLILTMILAGLFYFRAANRKLEQKNIQIEKQKEEIELSHHETEQERKKAEALLLNILPEETAVELKEKGGATPRNYQKVTVLFTDFSGFTRIAQDMSPQELIEELNTCFRAFDEIIEKYGLEKIKTIGDAYMCAGGIPVPNESNPEDAVAAALEMSQYITNRSNDKINQGIPYWNMRIGIHTGQVIAGVVGKKKFAYDIWGDTVNLASRMESSGEDGQINISGETYALVKEKFECAHRGQIDVKHKGKMDMFFVRSSLNGNGKH